jgi:hypothetical protein
MPSPSLDPQKLTPNYELNELDEDVTPKSSVKPEMLKKQKTMGKRDTISGTKGVTLKKTFGKLLAKKLVK